jgi:hypothetical protein
VAAPKIKSRQLRGRGFVASVEFPRWVVAAGAVILAFMLLLGGRDGVR